MRNDDAALDQLFEQYRAACPEPDAGANFMPQLWARIDARRGFAFAFGRLARTGAAAAAAFCLLLLLLNFAITPARTLAPTYADALAAESQAAALYGDGSQLVPVTAHATR
jgi:hypothetical protein